MEQFLSVLADEMYSASGPNATISSIIIVSSLVGIPPTIWRIMVMNSLSATSTPMSTPIPASINPGP